MYRIQYLSIVWILFLHLNSFITKKNNNVFRNKSSMDLEIGDISRKNDLLLSIWHFYNHQKYDLSLTFALVWFVPLWTLSINPIENVDQFVEWRKTKRKKQRTKKKNCIEVNQIRCFPLNTPFYIKPSIFAIVGIQCFKFHDNIIGMWVWCKNSNSRHWDTHTFPLNLAKKKFNRT